MSFGGPEIRDGICLLHEEASAVDDYDDVDDGKEGIHIRHTDEKASFDVGEGRLGLVHAALTVIPHRVIDRNWHWVTKLDLSYNKIE